MNKKEYARLKAIQRAEAHGHCFVIACDSKYNGIKLYLQSAENKKRNGKDWTQFVGCAEMFVDYDMACRNIKRFHAGNPQVLSVMEALQISR